MLVINKEICVVFFMFINIHSIFTFNIDGDDEANRIEYTVNSQNQSASSFFGYSIAFYKKFADAK